MISKISGNIDEFCESSVIINNDGVYYEVSIPPVQIEHLKETHKIGDKVLLFTMYYIEGGVGVGNLFPKLVGFLDRSDKEFFNIFTTVKGLGEKKALQAIIVPVPEIGSAIESGDVHSLKKLPGIGGRMADKIVAELKGKMTKYVSAYGVVNKVDIPDKIKDFEDDAMNILITQLGYRRVEAENLITKALSQDSSIDKVEDLLQRIFNTTTPVEKE
ncbi:Holliday junction branch migration protein RuvA [candidate division KSB1 bacterium]